MFSRSFQLFKIFGFAIRLDLSWFIIAILITWSLAVQAFPYYVEGLAPWAYWVMGVAGALGLFLSIVLHELGHALVARRFGLAIRGITLFIFGGVAEMTDEPPSPKAEFWVAVGGPIVSVMIAAVCLAVGVPLLGVSQPTGVVLTWLGVINGVLVVFNMVPAFPLDGGRVLRSIIWQVKRDLRYATRITAAIGSGFGIVLFGLAVLNLLTFNFIGAMWWFLLGLFLRGAAQASYQQVLIRRALEGETVRRFMTEQPKAAPPQITLRQFVDEYVYRDHFKMYPVTDDGRLIGCVSTRQVKELPQEQWTQRTVRDVADPCTAENTISPDADAMQALSQMNRTGLSRLIVAEGDRLVGVVALKDLMGFLALKIELETDDGRPTLLGSAQAPSLPDPAETDQRDSRGHAAQV